MRVPIAVDLESRDALRLKDPRMVNVVVEKKGEQLFVRKRPGMSDLGEVEVGTAQLLTVWNGIKTIQGDVLSSGTITTIVSAPEQDTLTTSNDYLPMDAQATNNDAATPRLFFKNRTQAWVVNRAGTVSTVSYASNMGAGTYNLISVTRSGTTATATLAEDVFNVGDTATIAGADQAAYNGAQTVTAVTTGTSTPARVIPITITRSSTTATATTVDGSDHGLTTATAYTIAGANQSEYNGSKTITTSGGSTFTFTVATSGSSYSDLTGTWNSADKSASTTLSGSDLVAATNAGGVRGTVGKSTGLWYWEVTATAANNGMQVGIATSAWTFNSTASSVYFYQGAATGDVIGIRLNMTTGVADFLRNGVLQYSVSGLAGTWYPAAYSTYPATATANFGATAFTYEQGEPITPATGNITVTDPAVTVNPTFTFTVAGSPATPATGTITATTNGGTVPGIAYINGYFAVMDLNGVIWHSDSDDPTTWGALAFITAQVENGAGMALATTNNYLVAFKEWSTEMFYDAQNEEGSVFSPVESGFTTIGCSSGASLANVNGSLVWIGQTRQEGRGVYVMRGLEQQKISNPDIDRFLMRDTLATVHAYGISISGHDLYVLTLVGTNITLVYDFTSGFWTQWQSNTIGSNKSVTSITFADGIATVTTGSAHGVTDGYPVKISGATQSEYNGIFQARVVSTTVFKIKVSGTPTTPATGTIVANPYSDGYFKFTKAANFNGQTLLLHESDGHLYKMQTTVYQDAGVPINVLFRTARMDGGTTDVKKLPVIRVIADKVGDVMMLRWSDDDCASFTSFRLVDLDSNAPEMLRCGSFRRRTIEGFHVGNVPLRLQALELEIG